MHQVQYIKMTKKERGERRKLLAALPKNWEAKLVAQFGCSEGHCRNVVSGSRRNDAILAAAVFLAADWQQEKIKTAQLLKEVADAS